MLCRTQSPLHWKGAGKKINIALWNCFKSVRFLRGPGLSAPLRLPDVLQLSHSVGKFSTGRQSQWTSTCNLQPGGVFSGCVSQLGCKAKHSSCQRSSHRHVRSLFIQNSVIKYNIIVVLFFIAQYFAAILQVQNIKAYLSGQSTQGESMHYSSLQLSLPSPFDLYLHWSNLTRNPSTPYQQPPAMSDTPVHLRV